MCDQEIDGRRIRVDFSITKKAHTPTPGVYMGRPTNIWMNKQKWYITIYYVMRKSAAPLSITFCVVYVDSRI